MEETTRIWALIADVETMWLRMAGVGSATSGLSCAFCGGWTPFGEGEEGDVGCRAFKR